MLETAWQVVNRPAHLQLNFKNTTKRILVVDIEFLGLKIWVQCISKAAQHFYSSIALLMFSQEVKYMPSLPFSLECIEVEHLSRRQ